MSFFTNSEQELIADAIAKAELTTSGEIRVALEKHCPNSAMERAQSYFYKLGMDKTAEHNGVLVYLAYKDKKFAIVGDKGINKLVPENFWEMTNVAMKAHFSSGQIAEGIIAGIALIGEQLAIYFPHRSDDINELSNEIVFLDKSTDE